MPVHTSAAPVVRTASHPACRPVGALAVTIALGAVLGGCGTFYQDSSPDVTYSRDSAAARRLQVPPDLTDVSDGEQFVLPGTEGAPLSRDTLLPVFDGVRFEREGAASWLAFDVAPEAIWPRLLGFARHEKYRIERTEPTAGQIFTQWRPASAVSESSLLGNLIGGERYTRLGFRLERTPDNGARLFLRRQSADEGAATGAAPLAWPAEPEDPEADAALAARLLVFLGVEEQRARGLLDPTEAAAILDDAVLASGSAGSRLTLNGGYEPSFRAVRDALGTLGHAITSSDDGVGRIEYVAGDSPEVLTLVPVHVGAVRVSLSDAEGRRLGPEREREALEALRVALLA